MSPMKVAFWEGGWMALVVEEEAEEAEEEEEESLGA